MHCRDRRYRAVVPVPEDVPPAGTDRPRRQGLGARSDEGGIPQLADAARGSTGRAPVHSIASAVAVNVLATVMTSSPGLTPSAFSATKIASVPFAEPTQCLAWANAAISRSKAATKGP